MPVSFKCRKNKLGAYEVTVGLAPCAGVIGVGDTPPDALHTAAALAANLAQVLKEHPELAQALPPGTVMALKGISAASYALDQDADIREVANEVGPATAKVVNKVLSLF